MGTVIAMAAHIRRIGRHRRQSDTDWSRWAICRSCGAAVGRTATAGSD